MICKKCGANVFEGIKNCPNCGEKLIDDVETTNVTTVTPEPVQPVVQPQPVNNVPPVMPTNNGMYNAPVQNNNKSNSGLIIVIIGIVVALIICIIIIASSTKKNDKGNNSNSVVNSNPTSTVTSNSNSVVNSNPASDSNPTSTVTSNTTTDSNVNFKGYSLQVPDSYEVNYVGTQLRLYGKNKKDVAVISIQDGNYDTIKTNSQTVDTYIAKEGYTVTKKTETTQLGGVEYLYLTVSKDSQNMIMAYAKLDSTHIFLIVLGSTDSSVDYTKLELFSNTILTAKKA